jgi:hypothetical protein
LYQVELSNAGVRLYAASAISSCPFIPISCEHQQVLRAVYRG